MKKFIFFILFIVSGLNSFSQENTRVTGNFHDISFIEFIEFIENETVYKFYYEEKWVEGISINLSLDNQEVNSFLQRILNNNNLSYFIDADYQIIIYPGEIITSKIPSFIANIQIAGESESIDDQLTDREKKYIEGQKKINIQEFIVGNPNENNRNIACILNGRIISKQSGEPIIGATIFIKELSKGAVTDLDGYFKLSVKPGRYEMVANSLSMKEEQFIVNVHSTGFFSIELEKELMNINEVRIVADKNSNVRGIQMGYERLTAVTIKEIPAVMGEKDVLKVAQMLPGVQSAGEGSAGIIVRGGSADQNLFYINKLPIYNTSHLFGFFGAFNPDIINDFSLHKSNIPSKYGGRASSVFDVSTRQGNKKEFYGKGGISPVTAHMIVEGPILKEKSSFVLSYRGTYSDWLLSRMSDEDLRNSNASFSDISGSIHSQVNDNNIVKVFGYFSADKFSLAASNDYQYSNKGATIDWKHFFNSSMHADFSFVHSEYSFLNNNKVNPSEAYTQDYQLLHDEAKADFVFLLGNNHKFSFGASSLLYTLNRGNIVPYNEESNRIPIELGLEKGLESALYIEDKISLKERLTLLAGLRYSGYSLLGPLEIDTYYDGMAKNQINVTGQKSFGSNEFVKWYHGPEPRFSANYLVGRNNSIKLSYNKLRQYIFMLSNTMAISPTDQWKLSDYYISPLVSDQISVGYYQDFIESGLVTSVEVYGKNIGNVLEYKDGIDFISGDPIERLVLQGDQKSYGAEFMVKKNIGKLTGWMSYTYSRSIVTVNTGIPDEFINLGQSYSSNYDKPHSFNLVGTVKSSRRISYSTVVTYSTGRPITYPVSVYYSGKKEVLHYSQRNEYRIPDYFRVDFSMNYEGNLLAKKWLHSTWMFNVYNIIGRNNAYSVFFEADNGKIKAYKLSIFGQPIVTLTWNFKFGNFVSD